MTERQPTASGAGGSGYQAAGSPLGKPGVVVQWDRKGRAKRQVPCVRVGQIAFNEMMLFVLEGEYVQGFVYLAEIQRITIQRRKSFRHPIIGFLVGLGCVLGPVSVLLGDPVGLAGLLGAGGGCGFLFVLGIGAFTLFEVITSRKVPWLVVTTKDGDRAFLLGEPVTAEQEQLVFAFDGVAGAAKVG